MLIPNATEAVVDIQKIRDYCLSANHPRGRHKAKVFAAKLGLSSNNAETLRKNLLTAVTNNDASLVGKDEFGTRYMLDCEMQGWKGKATVRTYWIIRTKENFPRLITCYVL